MPEVALLWDESFLWGLIAYDSLKALNLPFEVITSEDIRNGSLKNYRLLFVPGGWASNKQKALGEKGAEEIKDFVKNGGNYFGICGGAGLATADGIGLLNIRRKPTRDRVPSFSGRIYLDIGGGPWCTNESPIWKGIDRSNPVFYAWWPSQFLVDDQNIKVLATFGDALPDAFSSDLNVGDVSACWEDLERLYEINLDPARLRGEPAVVEGTYGKGKVLLSLIHFDTPDDKNGSKVLQNILEYVGAEVGMWGYTLSTQGSPKLQRKFFGVPELKTTSFRASELAIEELIDFGIRNFLWFWRTPVFLQWRRGVRGFEYCTLYWMIKRLSAMSSQTVDCPPKGSPKNFQCNFGVPVGCRIEEKLLVFIEKAKRLLIMERLAMQNGLITYERCDDPEIQKLRSELFGNSKSHGGLFKEILDKIDVIIYKHLKVATLGSSGH